VTIQNSITELWWTINWKGCGRQWSNHNLKYTLGKHTKPQPGWDVN